MKSCMISGANLPSEILSLIQTYIKEKGIITFFDLYDSHGDAYSFFIGNLHSLLINLD